MKAIILILVIVAIIWAGYFISNREKKLHSSDIPSQEIPQENETEELSKKGSGLKNTIRGFQTSPPEDKKPEIKSKKSLDMLYAESHGMWICRYCETINDGGAKYCDACGAKK